MKERRPRYSEGATRAGLAPVGSEVMVFSSVSESTRPYVATVVNIKRTSQIENPAVILKVRSESGHRWVSIGGGTSVDIL